MSAKERLPPYGDITVMRPTVGMASMENDMEYRKLGRSGLKVSPLCLGTMMFGGPTDEPTATRIIDHARAAGINFIDTASRLQASPSEACRIPPPSHPRPCAQR